jgi:hypothetical protein
MEPSSRVFRFATTKYRVDGPATVCTRHMVTPGLTAPPRLPLADMPRLKSNTLITFYVFVQYPYHMSNNPRLLIKVVCEGQVQDQLLEQHYDPCIQEKTYR